MYGWLISIAKLTNLSVTADNIPDNFSKKLILLARSWLFCNFDPAMTKSDIPETYVHNCRPAAPRAIELLAPARDAATAYAAIDHGADAVYMGAPAFGARAQAGNSLAEIASVVSYAHRFGVKIYVTVNTIVYDNELDQVNKLIWDLWRAGVDALIVQDLAITRMNLPPIALHASTQCDTRDPEKARFLESCGFTRLVLARELTLEEILEIRQAVHTDLEVFVHGALCVSYSGDCQASRMITGRSANRGECCQVCRFKFDLEDNAGNKIVRDRHLLSLRDMNRITNLKGLLDAGVCSLKIEGRLKDAAYVKNVVGAYRRELDRIIASAPQRYRRASFGKSTLNFNPDPSLSFNRGFTDYFLTSTQPSKGSLATFRSPKWIGKKAGIVKHTAGNIIVANTEVQLHNGDGLGYYAPDGEFKGFRLNRVDGNRLYPATEVNLPAGTVLYRNADKERDDILAGKTAVRKIDIAMNLARRGNQITLEIRDETGLEVTVALETEWQTARTPQTPRRRKELEKLGDTIFSPVAIHDKCGDWFIPASTLSRLRRMGTDMLETARQASYITERPGKPDTEIHLPDQYIITRHDNIANNVAAEFYASISGQNPNDLPRAIEIDGVGAERVEMDSHGRTMTGIQVMETRYCLRREMGCCLKTRDGVRLPSQLFLTSAGNRFRLDFDCARCRMRVILES